MSLRWRIMASTVLVVVLTVLASVGVGYYATQARLGVFVDRIGGDEAVQLARNLSREYTAAMVGERRTGRCPGPDTPTEEARRGSGPKEVRESTSRSLTRTRCESSSSASTDV